MSENKKESVKKELKYSVSENGNTGMVQIADDVVSSIVGLAVTEVDGVAKLSGNISRDLVAKLGKKNLANGVHISYEIDETGKNVVEVNVSIEICFGFNIVEVSKAVQEKVKQTLLTMTGLECSAVNVRIEGIYFEKE